MKYLKWADIPIFLINITIIVLFSLSVYSSSSQEPQVYIETEEDRWIYSIEEEQILNIPGRIGDSLVEIKEGKVRFLDSPCQDKLCEQMGWLESVNDWSACLPNGIMLIVEGESDEKPDAVSQ